MKIVLGTANFYHRYGVSNSKIKNIIELKKILNFLKRKKIRYIDTAFSYNINNKFRNKIDLSSFKIITKFKLPIKNKKLFIDNLNLKIENELKIFGINKFEAILLHNTNDLNSKYSDELILKLKELKKKKLVKNLGVSIYDKKEIGNVLKKLKLDIIQFPANIFDQRFLNVNFLNKLKKLKIKSQIRSVFLQGLLIKDIKKIKRFKNKNIIKKKISTLENWCIKNNIPKENVPLLFIKNYKKIDFLTLGIESLDQLKQNLALLKIDKIINLKKFATSNKKIIDPRKW
jgi:aryl-alcohol dehydrogenase-like predicted oxidoreductase